MLLMISLIFITTPKSVEAANWDREVTNFTVPAGHWYKIFDNMTTGDVFSGFFQTHSSTQGLDFFICDSANLALWESGYSATVHELNENMHYLGFSYNIPYDDTWYAVYSNYDGSSGVTADFGADLNDDSTPVYSGYDTSDYAVHLEPDDYETRVFSCGSGSSFTVEVSTWFSTDYVDVFFCDAENYNIYAEGGTASVYALETNVHTTTIDWTAPKNGPWYLVFSAVGEGDTVTLSYGVDYDCETYAPVTTSSTSTTEPETSTTSTSTTEPETSTSWSETAGGVQLGGLGFVIIGAALIGLVAAAVVWSRRRPSPPSTPGAYEVVTPGPGPPAGTVERPSPVSTVGAKILVICPYCGAKTEQGILECQNCGADL